MHCDVCKNNQATVFLTEIVDGKMKKVNLCESCSIEKGVTDPTAFALADKLFGKGVAQEIEKSAAVESCAVCGFTQTDFKKTGRLGCANCYETFEIGLDTLLKAMHKGLTHTGKIPSRLYRNLQIDNQRKNLQRDLQKAVEEERYESAAEIRDQLRKLEEGIGA